MSRKDYRGRRVDTLDWVYGFLSSYDTITTSEGMNVTIIPQTVGRSSGVSDMFGTTVYEGDIVVSKSFIVDGVNSYEVAFKDGSFGISYPHEGGIQFEPLCYLNSVYSLSIVGSIHDTIKDVNDSISMCGNDEMAIDILKFIASRYEKDLHKSFGNKKYIDAIARAVVALNRRIPQPAVVSGTDNDDVYICPACGSDLCEIDEFVAMMPRYCEDCGQAVKY